VDEMTGVQIDDANEPSSKTSGQGFHDDVADHVGEGEHEGEVDVGVITIRKFVEPLKCHRDSIQELT
jgi:hypothetical protein